MNPSTANKSGSDHPIQSLLDLDFYKLTMLQWAWKYFPEAIVKYRFTNRKKHIRLAEAIDMDQLRAELLRIQTLRFLKEEIEYLASLTFGNKSIFTPEFLEFLQDLSLPDFHLDSNDGYLVIEIEGPWMHIMLWETLVLSIVNELYFRAECERKGLSKEEVWAEGERRLRKKIDALRAYPAILKIIEFGTRRRFSRAWQRRVLEIFQEELPDYLVGTSNVLWAKELGLSPIGTFAHELFMVICALFYSQGDEQILASPTIVLQKWWEMYGFDLSIALTDTYGDQAFFRYFTEEMARKWKGLRQDSGDPLEFGEDAISFYNGFGINPLTKLLVFSDGLRIETIFSIADRFVKRILLAFGWGTNLTNDMGFDLESLSIVMKPVEAAGVATAKLTANIQKAMGPPEIIAELARIFAYDVTFSEKCVY